MKKFNDTIAGRKSENGDRLRLTGHPDRP